MGQAEQNIEIIVVVSGQSERLRVNIHQTLEHLARRRKKVVTARDGALMTARS